MGVLFLVLRIDSDTLEETYWNRNGRKGSNRGRREGCDMRSVSPKESKNLYDTKRDGVPEVYTVRETDMMKEGEMN